MWVVLHTHQCQSRQLQQGCTPGQVLTKLDPTACCLYPKCLRNADNPAAPVAGGYLLLLGIRAIFFLHINMTVPYSCWGTELQPMLLLRAGGQRSLCWQVSIRPKIGPNRHPPALH